MVWRHRVCEIDGRPAQILIDDQFRRNSPIPELPRLAWFGVYCRLDPGVAFWHPDESGVLDAIEDDLIERCNKSGGGRAVYVLRIATRGIRELFIYFGKPAAFSDVVLRLRATYPDYRIVYEERADEAWSRYKTCLPE